MRRGVTGVVKVIKMTLIRRPVFSFLKLCASFDVEAAQAPDGIDPRKGGLGADFFLADFKAEFIDNSRHLTSNAYCRIHQNIDTAILLNELGGSFSLFLSLSFLWSLHSLLPSTIFRASSR